MEFFNGHIIAADNQKLEYSYKPVDRVIQHEITQNNIVTEEFLETVASVDFVVGGDHGKGKFRMVLMILLRTRDPEKFKKFRFTVGELQCKKDTADLLRRSFLPIQNKAIKNIVNGGWFLVYTTNDGTVNLSFSTLAPGEVANPTIVCDVPTRVFGAGDLAFYAAVLGKEDMERIWCTWCKIRKAEWSQRGPMEDEISNIDTMIKQFEEGLEGAARMGMKEAPIWDCIEPENYLFPVLHVQLGLINDLINWLYNWINENVEETTEEEAELRHN
jgi:hypothetical protein